MPGRATLHNNICTGTTHPKSLHSSRPGCWMWRQVEASAYVSHEHPHVEEHALKPWTEVCGCAYATDPVTQHTFENGSCHLRARWPGRDTKGDEEGEQRWR